LLQILSLISTAELPSQDVKSIRFRAVRSSSHANLPYYVFISVRGESTETHRRTQDSWHILYSFWRDAQRKVRSLCHWQHSYLVLSERNILSFTEREFTASHRAKAI